MKQPLWTKDYTLVVLYSLLIYVVHFMLVATLPLYVKESGGNNFTAGLIMGVFSLAALILRPFFGQVLDRRGRKPVLIFGGILFLLGTFLPLFCSSVEMILVLRIIQGIGFGANTTAFGAMIADLTPPGRLAEGIGYFGITNPLGTAIGPVFGFALVGGCGYQTLFAVSASIVGINLLLSCFMNYEARQGGRGCSGEVAGKQAEETGPLIERNALPSAMVMFFMALAHGSILTFLPTYAMQRGIEGVGSFFLVYAGAIIVTRLITGKAGDRVKPVLVLIPGIIMVMLGLIVLSTVGTLIWFWGVAFLYGLGYGLVQPLLNAIAVQKSPVACRGMANAVFNSALDIGIGVGSVIWGLVAQKAGFTMVYVGAAGCAGVALTVTLSLRDWASQPGKLLAKADN